MVRIVAASNMLPYGRKIAPTAFLTWASCHLFASLNLPIRFCSFSKDGLYLANNPSRSISLHSPPPWNVSLFGACGCGEKAGVCFCLYGVTFRRAMRESFVLSYRFVFSVGLFKIVPQVAAIFVSHLFMHSLRFWAFREYLHVFCSHTSVCVFCLFVIVVFRCRHYFKVYYWDRSDRVLDNFSWTTFPQRPIKMKNNGENHTSMRSCNRSKINFKGALSCRFPFQNTAPCCDVRTVTKHNQADAAGCASHGGLLTWSATALCDVLSGMC